MAEKAALPDQPEVLNVNVGILGHVVSFLLLSVCLGFPIDGSFLAPEYRILTYINDSYD